MTTPKSLPARPSLESLRKQAKKLARDVAAANADAIARAHAQLPDAELPLSQRNAQLVLAREYGFAGWQDLTAEVLKRLGLGLEWAAHQAKRSIHDNDLERLQQLLTEYPALLSWRGDGGGLLGNAVSSYGDSFDPFREEHFTRRACAELLIDSGAVIDRPLLEGVVRSRAKGMLQLLWNKGLLPRRLEILIGLGDLGAVRECFDEHGTLRVGASDSGGNESTVLNEAFICACRFAHEPIASFLLERCIALDADLRIYIDAGPGREAFIRFLIEHARGLVASLSAYEALTDPWQAFVMHRMLCSIDDDDLPAFLQLLEREAWVLGESRVDFQVTLIERATLQNRASFIAQLLDLNPALSRRHTPPRSQVLEFAFEYAKVHLVPLLTRIWQLPDDLPTAAGMGDLSRVRRWFDGAGEPALGNPADHYPGDIRQQGFAFHREPPSVQRVLDTALAWACLNNRFDVADFLLEHGADINTRWSTHEPASILHELVFHENYAAMQFLIDRGIDMTIEDYRWGGTAQGWALHAAGNEKMSEWLAAAERKQKERAT